MENETPGLSYPVENREPEKNVDAEAGEILMERKRRTGSGLTRV
jgi:hypothetical protein